MTHQGRSETVERALTDFGIEESFAQASKRFEEHCGWAVDRTTLGRVTQSISREAQAYVEDKLAEARRAYDMPLSQRLGVARLVTELDGCQIRTAEYVPGERPKRTVGFQITPSKSCMFFSQSLDEEGRIIELY